VFGLVSDLKPANIMLTRVRLGSGLPPTRTCAETGSQLTQYGDAESSMSLGIRALFGATGKGQLFINLEWIVCIKKPLLAPPTKA